MLKKAILLSLIFLYLYFHTFNIFLNKFITIPTPLLFGLPIVIFFRERITNFLYYKEVLLLVATNFIYYYVAQSDGTSFVVNSIIITVCALFFNYVVGYNTGRMKSTLYIYYLLLILSTVVMFLNHVYPDKINVLRSQLIGGDIRQSPSGITAAIYNYGYQLAALVGFLFINTLVFNRSTLIKLITFIFCLLAIYFGMQRSVLLTFTCCVLLFSLAYYKLKAVPFIIVIALISVMFSMFFLEKNADNYDNIFAKNERNAGENRSGLVTENLKIYMDYPYGLIFHGKTWGEVTRNNKVFKDGLTSHNAYLMFITNLGPFLGLLLLILIYYRVAKIFKYNLLHIREIENGLLICLCFSFLSASMNSLFHNSWFVGGNGPLVFLYFAILQLHNQKSLAKESIPEIIKSNPGKNLAYTS